MSVEEICFLQKIENVSRIFYQIFIYVFMKHFSSFLFFLFIRNLTQVPEFGNHLLRYKSMLQAYFKLTFRISASISEPDVVG